MPSKNTTLTAATNTQRQPQMGLEIDRFAEKFVRLLVRFGT
jgi:hypothetical protein